MSLHTHFFIELFFQFYQIILAFGHQGGIGILAQLLPFHKNNLKTMKINVRIILITGQTILMIFIIFHAISWPKRQKHSHLSVIIFVFKTLTGRTSWRFIKKGGFKDNCIVIVSYMMITADDKTKIFPKIRENYSLGTRSFLTFILLYSK